MRQKGSLVYFVLAACEILTISLSLYLAHELATQHDATIHASQRWSDRVARYVALGQAATQVNAPGNDVFSSNDVPVERQRMQRARERFDALVAEAKDDLDGLPPRLAADVRAALDQLDENVAGMTRAGDRLFVRLAEGDLATASREMASMDHELVRVQAVIAELVAHVQDLQAREVDAHAAAADRIARTSLATALAIGVSVLGVLLHGFVLQRRVARDADERASHLAEVEAWALELGKRNEDIRMIGFVAEQLQASETAGEAQAILERMVQQTFPSLAGALYVTGEGDSPLSRAVGWGGHEGPRELAPEGCWALRRGKVHEVEPGSVTQPCPHVEARWRRSACLPMIVNGRPIGVLHLAQGDLGPAGPIPSQVGAAEWKRAVQMAPAIADQVALVLANLRLREHLRTQSVRDPLTGLFNRRHMDAVLPRAIVEAILRERSLGLLMLDVDHFKRVNDTEGHDAGDAVLRALADLLGKSVRGDDLAVRLGGEEFAVVLTNTPLEEIVGRAGRLLESVRALRISHRGRRLPRVTASIGVALAPRHGSTAEELLHAADEALYEAKRAGRDRLFVAGAAHVAHAEAGG